MDKNLDPWIRSTRMKLDITLDEMDILRGILKSWKKLDDTDTDQYENHMCIKPEYRSYTIANRLIDLFDKLIKIEKEGRPND